MSGVAINVERWKQADTVLLDIEGTISSISFVKDILYPYALSRLTQLAHDSWKGETFQELIAAFPEETRKDAATLVAHVEDLTTKDIKAVYLKQLQGKLWKRGYESGEITTPLFPDVVPTLSAWRAHSKRLAIFSSGSVEAQQNFFKYIEADPSRTETDSGTKSTTQDLNPDFVGKFDTVTAGPKVVKESYEKICNALNTTPEKVVFLTDNVREAVAATSAGVYTIVVDRPGNAPLSEADYQSFPVIRQLPDIPI